MERFSDNLLRLGGMHRLTNKQLAALVGVNYTTLAAWNRGAYKPSADNLLSIATLFEVPPTALASEPFAALLPHISDPARYERIENRIRKTRTQS